MAVKYFIESINSYDFVASKCDRHNSFPFMYLANYTSYEWGFCKNYPTALMGENCDTNARGSYYLTTNSKSPFAKGKQ